MVFGDLLKAGWMQAGFGGLLIFCLIFAIYKMNGYIEKRDVLHRQERDKWTSDIKKQTDTVIEVVKQNSTVISELSTLIKNK